MMDYARHEENRMKQQTNRNRRWVLASRPHGPVKGRCY
ncbi:hypothetical protein LTSEALA_2332, partial [Salmonella enterica subsp. enterica serovar Alachua str. R6-377]